MRLEAAAPAADESGRKGLEAILDSLDVRPFPNPRLHADWNRSWTIAVPDGWTLQPGRRSARFVSPDGTCVLAVDGWDDMPLARNHRGIQGLEQWVDAGVRSVLEETLGGEPIVEHDEPEVAEVGLGAGVEGRLAGFRVRTAAQKAKGEHGFATVLVSERFRVMLLSRQEGSAPSKAGYEALRTFELDTLDASRTAKPRADVPGPETPPTDTFDREGAPAVVFRVPADWKKEAPKSSMRLAQWTLPGDPPGEAAVFFFGAGGGGGVSGNLERWKGQITGGESKTEEVAVADGIRATVLDAKGAYSAETMPGSGERVSIPEARLLAAVIECPGGPLFVKAFGAKATMDAAAGPFNAWIRSFRKKP